MESQILIADEVAELLRVDRQRIYQLVRTNHIPVIRIGPRQYRFSRTAIVQWLENGGDSEAISQIIDRHEVSER
jgi:excisionase family DNA binding protein